MTSHYEITSSVDVRYIPTKYERRKKIRKLSFLDRISELRQQFEIVFGWISSPIVHICINKCIKPINKASNLKAIQIYRISLTMILTTFFGILNSTRFESILVLDMNSNESDYLID